MTPKELKALAKTMRELGISHYKAGDVELVLSLDVPVKAPALAAQAEHNKEAKQRVDDISSILDMDDESLLDRMFPLPPDSEAM